MNSLRSAALVFSLVAGGGPLVPSLAHAAAAEPQIVTLAMKEYAFVPSHLTFKRGIAYRLHLVNEGKELHEFTAPKFFKSVAVKNPKLLVNGGAEIVLQPHETKDFDFTPKKTGHFSLTCADHDWIGMTGDISVE